MLEYIESMELESADVDYMNNLVSRINGLLGKEVFELRNSEGEEDKNADLYQDGEMNSSYIPFDEITYYLQGIHNGAMLANELLTPQKVTDNAKNKEL